MSNQRSGYDSLHDSTFTTPPPLMSVHMGFWPIAKDAVIIWSWVCANVTGDELLEVLHG